MLERHNLDLWFVDGNHSDHDTLHQLPAGSDGTRPISGNRLLHGHRFTGHMRWLPRGHRWTWGGFEWLALGGAYSVDQDHLTEGVDWFRDEALSDAQAATAIAGGPVDVVVAHDAPWIVDSELYHRLRQYAPADGRRTWIPERHLRASDQHQKRLRWVLDEVQPARWFHGHHHWRYTAQVGSCTVEGLGKNGQGGRHLCLLVDNTGTPICT